MLKNLYKSSTHFVKTLRGVLLLCLSFSGQAQTINLPGRIEIHVVPSTTVSGEEFLLGQKGRGVNLSGELRLPQGNVPKFPAVILVHGSGGISGSMDAWVHHFNQAGIATFVLDTFTGRGITSTVVDQTQLHSLAMMVDAYRALDLLAMHPRIEAKKISVMGFSKGAVASIFSASTRFTKSYGSDATFASHIGLYTPCNSRFLGDADLTGKPMRMFHGTTDDYVSVQPCRDYVKTLQQAGVNITLTEYPDTDHGYDSPLSPKRLKVTAAQSTRNCMFIEKTPSVMANEKTGEPFSYKDACIATGAHVGHNPESAAATVKAILDFLKML